MISMEEISSEIGIKDPTFLRLAIENFMDGTNKQCFYCKYKYKDLDDCIEKDVTLAKKPNIICCRKCFNHESPSP